MAFIHRDTLPKNFAPLTKPRTSAIDGLEYTRKDFSLLIQKAEYQQAAINRLQEKYHQRLCELEQLIRSNTVRFFGVEESPQEDTYLVILDILRRNMKIQADMSDLESCFRLGVDRTKTRPIVVRFASRHLKTMVLKNKKLLKGTNMGLAEDLSPERAQLYNEAMRHFGKRKVWIVRGDVKVALPNGSQVVFHASSELADFLNKAGQ